MDWNSYVAGLPEANHSRLIVALGAALQAVRQASAIATENGEVAVASQAVTAAIAHLLDVQKLLPPA